MNISVSSLKNWADIVKEAYFVNNMEPNDMVEEIARANDLNPAQVERVCQASNLSIKMASRQGKVDNVMFPLASSGEVQSRLQPGSTWEEPMETGKMASLAPESRIGEFSRLFLTQSDGTGMEKLASATSISSRSSLAMVKEIDRRYKGKRRELSSVKTAAVKSFNQIMDYLADEMKIARNINSSYTVASSILDSGIVEDIYKVAHKMLCESHTYPYPVPEMEKTAGLIPNPSCKIAAYINEYSGLLSEVESGEIELKRIGGELKTAQRRLQETILEEI